MPAVVSDFVLLEVLTEVFTYGQTVKPLYILVP